MKRNLTWGLATVVGVALFGATLLATGCERSITPATGGETHWLESCDSDAECGTELSCACGICTVNCTSNSSCDAVAEGGRCVSRTDADFADSCASTAPAQVCAPVASAGGAGGTSAGGSGPGGDGAGGAGGNGGSAPNEIRGARYDVDGNCFGQSEVAGTLTVPTGSGLSCDDALTYAFEADGTCWLFNDSCIPDGFIAQGDPPMGPALATCTQTTGPCPGVLPGTCSDGLVGSDGECLSCDEARARNYAALDELALDETLLSCQVDTDCGVLSTDTLCGGTCGKVAALATRDQFAEGVAEISEQYCSEPDWNEVCGFSTPDCEQPVFSCQGNRCVYGAQPACVAQGGCDSPLECFAETCARPCTDSDQCGAEERCVKEESPGCLLAVVDPSATDSGRCLARCQTDADCGDEAPSCWAGYCVGELPACEAACPKIADSCGGACDEINGHGYHPDDVCRDAEPVVLGCVPTGRLSTSDDTCVVSPEGVVFSGLSGSHSGQLVRNGGYVSCTEAEFNAASDNPTTCE